MTPKFIDSLLRQINSLSDTNEWESGDEPINESFKTFLKMLDMIKPKRCPGLGLSHTGNIIAAWTNERDRLTVECFPEDHVSWILTRYIDDTNDKPVRVFGQNNVSELVSEWAI